MKLDDIKKSQEEIKRNVEHLTKSQRELLLYRYIVKEGMVEDKSNGFSIYNYNEEISIDALASFAEAFDLGTLKTYFVYKLRNLKLQNQEIYKESLIHYYKVLENYKKLAEELKIDSSLNLSNLLTYMLWNGYYSVNKKHCYNSGNLPLLGMTSFDVIKGKGVCLAYAELLDNYLTVCGKESTISSCKVSTRKNAVNFDYLPNIERNMKGNNNKIAYYLTNFLLNGITNKVGNHAITLIKDNDKLYGYDPTNISILNIKDTYTATLVNGKGEYHLKPLMILLINSPSITSNIYDNLFFKDIKPALTKKEFIESFDEIFEIVNNNKVLLDDAYDSIHSDLEFINNQVDEIRNISKTKKK